MKIYINPCKSQFYYIKVGVKIIKERFRDAMLQLTYMGENDQYFFSTLLPYTKSL